MFIRYKYLILIRLILIDYSNNSEMIYLIKYFSQIIPENKSYVHTIDFLDFFILLL